MVRVPRHTRRLKAQLFRTKVDAVLDGPAGLEHVRKRSGGFASAWASMSRDSGQSTDTSNGSSALSDLDKEFDDFVAEPRLFDTTPRECKPPDRYTRDLGKLCELQAESRQATVTGPFAEEATVIRRRSH